MLDPAGRYLITGGTGFLGRELIRTLVGQGITNLVVVARNEGKLVALKTEFPTIEILPGDVSDPVVCAKACRLVDGVFHLAAFKHVPMAETDSYECVRSNINGTLNLLVESIGRTGNGSPAFFVYISTDKAAQVTGVYGATKFVGEKVVQEFQKINSVTKYSIIRYGNVFGSTGSFIHKWQKAVKAGEPIVITDPDATRFFFTVDSAVKLIMAAVEAGSGLVIPYIKAVRMGVVAEAFSEHVGGCEIKTIGLQPGENKHETMNGVTFSDEAEQYTKDEFKAEFLCPTM